MKTLTIAATALAAAFTTALAAEPPHGPADAWRHASSYGEPNHYLGPALYDMYSDIFHSRSLQTSSQRGTFRTTVSCDNGNCADDTAYVCADDASSAPGLDTNGDGTSEIVPGDVVYIGDPYALNARPPRIRTHVVASVVPGTGENGCSASQKRVEVLGLIRSREESVTAGMYIVNAWSNSAHPTSGTLYLAGRRLGYASRMFDGLQGPNLVENGNCEFPSPPLPDNWETDSVAHPLVPQAYPVVNPTTEPANCIDGESGIGDCFSYASPSPGRIVTSALIPLTPGTRYGLSAWTLPSTPQDASDYLALEDAAGNEIAGSRLDLTSSLFDRFGGTAHYVYRGVTIPPGITSARVVYAKAGTAPNRPWLDDVAVRQIFSYGLDASGDVPESFLVNDPGPRTILYTGDSWAESAYGQAFALGLASALSERYGRDFTGQIVWSGSSGDSTGDLLRHWDERVTDYDPLYCIISIGTNDVLGGVPESVFASNLEAIVRRSRCAGCIPIFLGLSPVTDSSGGHRATAYRYRELERSLLRDDSIARPSPLTRRALQNLDTLAWTALCGAPRHRQGKRGFATR